MNTCQIRQHPLVKSASVQFKIKIFFATIELACQNKNKTQMFILSTGH